MLGGAHPPGDMLALEYHTAIGAMLIWVTCDDDIWTQIAARVHVWTHGPIATWIRVDIHGPRCHQRSHRFPGFGPPPVAELVSEGCASDEAI